jgi:hypothetical protein
LGILGRASLLECGPVVESTLVCLVAAVLLITGVVRRTTLTKGLGKRVRWIVVVAGVVLVDVSVVVAAAFVVSEIYPMDPYVEVGGHTGVLENGPVGLGWTMIHHGLVSDTTGSRRMHHIEGEWIVMSPSSQEPVMESCHQELDDVDGSNQP